MARAKADADRDNRERWEREGRIAPKSNTIWSYEVPDFLRKRVPFSLSGGEKIECI